MYPLGVLSRESELIGHCFYTVVVVEGVNNVLGERLAKR